MRLRKNFTEQKQENSGELSPKGTERWIGCYLKKDDFTIDCGSTHSSANFIRTIKNTLIRDYKQIKNHKVSMKGGERTRTTA